MRSNDVRTSFLEYFAKAGHTVVPSASLVPMNDPTLMFNVAGMAPFKNVFTGLETRPYSTAASAQKCVRAGGKHNDLDNVGYTTRHNTFFEMLGNFSFGDYFKERAIELAWGLITKEWGLPKERLLVTVYAHDEEAPVLWRKIAGLSDDRIIRIPTSDNFWSMGDTGPCGPCTEIFFDHGPHIAGGPPGSPDEDGDRWVEVWNLVFMQYDQQNGEKLPLPRPSIDTGMGLERISAVLQGKTDSFAIDTFRALIEAAAHATGSDPDGPNRISYRVMADHLRASAFLIADGVLPANDGRGYVLRRIMRRAMRHAHLSGAKDAVMHQLVPALLTQMGGAYPELGRAQALIRETLHQEENRFRVTLGKGLKLLDEEVARLGSTKTLNGGVAFKLYDTYGFPLDLTQDALRAQGLEVDQAGFDAAMAQQRAAARAAWTGSGQLATESVWFELLDAHGPTEFIGYSLDQGEAVITALLKDGAPVQAAQAGDSVLILTNQTPFYGESGGQQGDTGTLTTADGARILIEGTAKKLGQLHVHSARIESGSLTVGQPVTLTIDTARRNALRANHSATHLLHEALRRRLGAHVTQKGSLVAPDRLRFDFAHPRPLTAEELADIEADVNARIRGNTDVTTRLMAPDAAIEAGAMALFGEKYGDEVRVVAMGADSETRYSVELCGGSHVNRTGDIGQLRILSDAAVASGVRRIEALTAEGARLYAVEQEAQLKAIAATLKTSPADAAARVQTLVEEKRKLEKDLADLKRRVALGSAGSGDSSANTARTVAGVAFLSQVLDDTPAKDLRGLVDEARASLGSGVVAFFSKAEGKASVAIGVSADLTARLSAVDLVRVAASALGGTGGGGRPDMAQAGGPAIDQIDAALAALEAKIAA